MHLPKPLSPETIPCIPAARDMVPHPGGGCGSVRCFPCSIPIPHSLSAVIPAPLPLRHRFLREDDSFPCLGTSRGRWNLPRLQTVPLPSAEVLARSSHPPGGRSRPSKPRRRTSPPAGAVTLDGELASPSTAVTPGAARRQHPASNTVVFAPSHVWRVALHASFEWPDSRACNFPCPLRSVSGAFCAPSAVCA